MPALLGWCCAWATFVGVDHLGVAVPWAFVAGCSVGLACAALAGSPWRRWCVGLGFPTSALALGAGSGLPSWVWLAALLPLLAAYPLRAWRDAPFYPTAANALEGSSAVVALPDGALILDAGCGLGHGLQALRRVWPEARLQGIESSLLLRALAGWRCPWAVVRCADMWRSSWADADLVYLFQRPESMARAFAKAQREMRPGSWLVSLEFAVPGVPAQARLEPPGKRTVWVYRMYPGGNPQSRGRCADIAP